MSDSKTTAVVIPKHGGYEVLEVREWPVPELAEDEIKVAVHRCGLNFAELMARQGLYPEAPAPPSVVGYEFAGVVEETKSDKFSVGDRVFGLTRFGGHASEIAVPAGYAFKMPDAMTFDQGAAMPVTYLTAFHSMFRMANLRKGESILIHSAAGGVGTAATQLAKTLDNVKIFGTASPGKHEFLKENGVTPLSYEAFDTQLKEAEPRGVNVILDAVGGDSLRRGYAILRKPGRLVCFGFSTAVSGATRSIMSLVSGFWNSPKWSPFALMDSNASISGVNMLKFFDDPDVVREEMEELVELFEAGKIAPVVDSVFAFSKAGDAHRHMQERKSKGKVLLAPDSRLA